MTDTVSVAGRKRNWHQRLTRWTRHNSVQLYALVLVVLLGLIVLAPRIFISVPAGHVGVHWMRFFGGTVTEYYYGEGIHAIFPWDEIIVYDARLQNSARIYDTISSDGLSMQVEIAVRFRINRDAVGFLHRLVGPNYPDVLVYPEIGSHARALISTYTPEQLYTGARSFIQAQILERMVRELGASLANQSAGGRLIEVEDVLIRSVKLPDSIASAIERKVEQYHAMLEYDFRIEREKKERERKKIEAEGVREFQDIVSHTITQEYLRLRGIEATMALATSTNSKMIVIGGRDGLPIILNTGDNAASATTPGGSTGALIPGGQPIPYLNPQNAAPGADDVTTGRNTAPPLPANGFGLSVTPSQVLPAAPGTQDPEQPVGTSGNPGPEQGRDDAGSTVIRDSMQPVRDGSGAVRD